MRQPGRSMCDNRHSGLAPLVDRGRQLRRRPRRGRRDPLPHPVTALIASKGGASRWGDLRVVTHCCLGLVASQHATCPGSAEVCGGRDSQAALLCAAR